ncbi:hypothetical protein G3260_002470 [Streptomyces albus]|uniref:SCO2583 family membrane protein n=1 Tax=Streptomyces TaxID=1883 RepID=UPI0004CD5DE2|nr:MULTISPECIES: hypothetical protein [Streptomyces]KPC94140.1 membrane protein [Streptomyces sp. NRRL F-6602]QID36327.1 hypothetical protein G3260_002470 [Streptomyces albus]
MAGRVDPPDGMPDGAPGGDDEYRSLVFDESFIKAARLQEFSAKERLEDEEHAAVRARSDAEREGRAALGFSRQGLVLVLLIVIAFGTAIYMGIRNPYRTPPRAGDEPLRSEVMPLAPVDPVPGATPADLFAHSPAARFAKGADGVTLPAPVRGSDHFSESQVQAALLAAKDYIVESSIDPEVLTGAVQPVRALLAPRQQRQFDRSVNDPRDDGKHAATAWMVRFDRARAVLASDQVRVRGTLTAQEVATNALEVTADHVFVYALRPTEAGRGKDADKAASLFSVRREVRFHIERSDLQDHRVSLRQVSMRVGPMNCGEDPSDTLSPLLAGERAKDAGKAGTDPFARGRSTASMCGLLAADAQPKPAHPARQEG